MLKGLVMELPHSRTAAEVSCQLPAPRPAVREGCDAARVGGMMHARPPLDTGGPVTSLHGTSGTFLLFVYGTLKRGGIRHSVLARARGCGEVQTRPLYALH